MAKITYSSEWMKNQKHAMIMSPEKEFKVFQTDKGYALYFSIGTDDAFYISKEQPGNSLGWDKENLSERLSVKYDNKSIVVKSFDVSQNITTGNIDIAIIVTIDEDDQLFIATNNSNSDTSWIKNLVWKAIPFDGENKPSCIKIKNIFIAQSHDGEYIIADIMKDPGSSSSYVRRYYIDKKRTKSKKYWNSHDLSGNLESTKIKSCLGRKNKDHIDGIYTLGEIHGRKELIYTPTYSWFNKKHPFTPASPTQLTVPKSASCLDAVATNDDYTALFVASDNKLHYFPYDKQKKSNGRNAEGIVVVKNKIFNKTLKISAHVIDNEIVVWGLNKSGKIFYTKCNVENALESTSWQTPVPIQSGVEQIAFYLNNNNKGSTLFAHTHGQELVKLSQQPETSLWQKEFVLLPPADLNNYIEFNSFTTHINIIGEDKLPVADAKISLSSIYDCSVYINDKYYRLSPDYKTEILSDITGTITIVQKSNSMSALSYVLEWPGTTISEKINPMDKLLKRIENINTVADLDKVEITDSFGSTKKLVPEDTSTKDKTATVDSLKQFIEISKKLPEDGSIQSSNRRSLMNTSVGFKPTTQNIWGMTFDGDGISYTSGNEAMTQFGLYPDPQNNAIAVRRTTYNLKSLDSAIWSTAGDIFSWIKDSVDEVMSFFVREVAEGIYHFFIEIGEILYRFVLDCISQVVDAIEFIFNKINVLLEDLIKWLGYIFNWDNILRIKRVFENIMCLGKNEIIHQIDNCEENITDAFEAIRNNLFKNLKGMDKSNEIFKQRLSNSKSTEKEDPEVQDAIDAPQNNWINSHIKSNESNATVKHKSVDELVTDVVNAIKNAGETQIHIIENAIQEFIDNVFKDAKDLSVFEIIERLAEIGFEGILNTFENIALSVFDAFKIVIEIMWTILNAEVEIPILTAFYEKTIVQGQGKLTILDLCCLMVAIPVGAGIKLVESVTGVPEMPISVLENAASATTMDDLIKIFTEKIPQAHNEAPMPLKASGITLTAQVNEPISWLDYLATGYQFSNSILYVGILFGDISQFAIDQSPTPIPGNFFTKLKTGCGLVQTMYSVFYVCVLVHRKFKMTADLWLRIAAVAGAFLLVGFNAILAILSNGIVIGIMALASIITCLISAGYNIYKLIDLIENESEYEDKSVFENIEMLDVLYILQNFAISASKISLAINKYSSYIPPGTGISDAIKVFLKAEALDIIKSCDLVAITIPSIRGTLYLYQIKNGYRVY